MFHVITGGSGSGKSAYAEEELLRLAANCPGAEKYYIATMEPFGEETLKKIERHRRLRAGKGFQTVECYAGLAGCAKELVKEAGGKNVNEKDEDCDRRKRCVLLECMSNLVANEMYRPDGAREHTVREILSGVSMLLETCTHVVVVTNEVCSDGNAESEEMMQYKQNLSRINQRMAQMADAVTEVVYGIPVEIKR